MSIQKPEQLFQKMMNEIHRLQRHNQSLQSELNRLQTELSTPSPPPSIEYKMETCPPPLPPIYYPATPESETEACVVCYEENAVDITCSVCHKSICGDCHSRLTKPGTRCPMCRSEVLPRQQVYFFDSNLLYRVQHSLPVHFTQWSDMIPTANALANAFGYESWEVNPIYLACAQIIRDHILSSRRKTIRFYYMHTVNGDELTLFERLTPTLRNNGNEYHSFVLRIRASYA